MVVRAYRPRDAEGQSPRGYAGEQAAEYPKWILLAAAPNRSVARAGPPRYHEVHTTGREEKTIPTETRAVPLEHPTEHPYIVRAPGICSRRPIIKGTRVSVRHIAQLHKAGDTVEEVLQAYPSLQAAAVYDAISDYLDHQQEIEQEIADNRPSSRAVSDSGAETPPESLWDLRVQPGITRRSSSLSASGSCQRSPAAAAHAKTARTPAPAASHPPATARRRP